MVERGGSMGAFEEITENRIKIRAIGVGGGGNNAINHMVARGIRGVELIAANTDYQALTNCAVDAKLQLGTRLTKGLGAGSDPSIGRDSAMEDNARIVQLIEGSDMVFVTAGMGGGTGTGAAPVIANIAKEMGILTVGVVTKPFLFEGKKRQRVAEEGVQALRKVVDTLIVIPNERLMTMAETKVSFAKSFSLADDILFQAVQSICDIINHNGYINVDFADVRSVMVNRGMALMGTGLSKGENALVDATHKAISSPLLEDVSSSGATGILMTVMGASENISLVDVNKAATIVNEEAHEDVNFKFGFVIDEDMGEEVKVTVIATGFPSALETAVTIAPARTGNTNTLPMGSQAPQGATQTGPFPLSTADKPAYQPYQTATPSFRDSQNMPYRDNSAMSESVLIAKATRGKKQEAETSQMKLFPDILPKVTWPEQNKRVQLPEDLDPDIPAFLRQRID